MAEQQVKFAVIADLHHALIYNGLQRLTQFLNAARRYSEKTERANPYLQYIEPYSKALYSIVTLDSEGMQTNEISGSFVQPDAKALGAPQNPRTVRRPCVAKREEKW